MNFDAFDYIVRVQKGRFSAPKLMLPMCVFSKRFSWMKLGTSGAERTIWVREHRKARLNSRFDAELLPDLLRVRYRIYELSVELMKFDIARKPTFEPRSLILEVASIGFLIKSGLFEQPLIDSRA
ncbi:hypothetical protein M4D81_02210 [Paenibacillus sp. p3-SID867]|uniref:hypothetical protein n=1 Tax=Paenibacillus sp. p3-SID867 TaxID=2916363 RepID=UPI0021A30272|nr:hypothetical protein [Paenibacillus sp. p3-SID867]MCT1397821.1 hypothetical protein [Paenibacillus sp. p3-SID867]